MKYFYFIAVLTEFFLGHLYFTIYISVDFHFYFSTFPEENGYFYFKAFPIGIFATRY